MGLSAASQRHSPWAQDPEALLLFTLEIARDDPRLFDETLDWLVRNESIVSARRLRTLCDGPDDERLVGAALEWVARHRRRAGSTRPPTPDDAGPQPLFRGLSTTVRNPDPAFLAHDLIRPEVRPTGKSREPDLNAPINLALRLRHVLGVSARAEAVRYLLTADGRTATAAAVASSAGYTKRNVHEALASLHSAGVASLVTIGVDQRYGIDRSRWAHLLGVEANDVPTHRDWPQLLSVLSTILRWLDRPELEHLSDYLRGSQARDLLDGVRPRLAHAGVVTAAWRGGDLAWDDLVETVENALLALGLADAGAGSPASFEVYPDASGHHRWRLSTINGRIVATSSESYATSANARAAAERLRSNAASYRYAIDTDNAGNHRWRARATNGQSVATSAESFSSRQSAERAARGARELASSAGGP